MPRLTKEISEGNLGTIPFPLISWILHIINQLVDTINEKYKSTILSYKITNDDGKFVEFQINAESIESLVYLP